MLLIIVSVLICLIFLNWLGMKPFFFKNQGIHYNLPLPILGNAAGEILYMLHEFWYNKYVETKKNGGVMGYYRFSSRSLIISNPKLVKEVLIHQSDMFNSHGVHTNPKDDPFAKNVFFVAGDEWKRIRSKLTPYFSPLSLKLMTTLMSSNMKEYTGKFEEASVCRKSINVNDLSLKLSTDIVVNTMFGIKPDSFTNPNSFFFLIQEQLTNYEFILKLLLGTISPRLYDLLKTTSIPKDSAEKLNGFINEVLDQRSKNNGVRHDFIQGMHELIEKYSQDNNKGLSKEEAIAQCMAVFLGGTETIGNSMSYLLYELAIHQEIQDKVRDEINQVLAATDDGNFTYDALSKLTYTNMVIYEILRKYPILPLILRSCTKRTKLAGIDVEPGFNIFIPVLGFHRDPEIYEEPDNFIPERFAEGILDDSTFLPFGIGPRTCLGWKMAHIELAFVLCEVIPKFKILPSDKTKSKINFTWKPTLNPDGGIWLNIEKI